jgi:hypothetical protein
MFSTDWRYELLKRREFAQLRLAKLAPRWLAYWCFIRIMADVSTGPLKGEAVPEIRAMDALKAWERS